MKLGSKIWECGRGVPKTFQQGYCFPCTRRLAACDMCILKPELCHYHQGTCRQPEWGETHCMREHIVYLANTSGLKVGITRKVNVPHRWIDQGAVQALPIAEVSNRRISGLFEVACKGHIADKTNWRKLLQGHPDRADLKTSWQAIYPEISGVLDAIKAEFGEDSIALLGDSPVDIHYPLIEFPEKIISLNFDKQPVIDATLTGIKGQYLMFDTGVINMRKFAGYHLMVDI